MQRRPYIITAALVLGLALGVVLAPSIRSTIASAQTPTQSTGDSLWNSFLDKLAAALNIDRATLDSAIVTAGNNTADEAVQQGTLTQAQADALKQRLQQGEFRSLLGGRGGKGFGGPRVAGVKQAMFDAAASTLNLSTDELTTRLRNGDTLTAIAQAQGTTEQAVIDAALAAARTQLDQAVTAGTLTQAQADAIYSDLQSRGADLLTHRGRGHRPRGWRDGTMPAPSASPSASPQSSDA
jgi:ribosomal protein S20